LYAIAVSVLFVLCVVSTGYPRDEEKRPERILSMTPAGTEILYSLGLGDRVIGVTRYCNWPPEALEKPVIGDMMIVNLESLAVMNPDLVLLSNMNEHLNAKIEAMGYRTIVVYQDDFEQICKSIQDVGDACGISGEAGANVAELRKSVLSMTIPPLSSGDARSSPRVLVVVGRDPKDYDLKKIYVAGVKSFYNDLIRESGASNALDLDVPYAQMSREGLLRVDPDIIIDLIGEHGGADIATGEILGQWKVIEDLRAARDGDTAIIKGDFTLRPGPRYPLILAAFIRAIHGGEREITE
jgi:iron complex transport system substrate-binding protein